MAEYEELVEERQQREQRLKQFQAAARAVGEEMERQGFSEEEALAQLEQNREQTYREKYGDSTTR